MKISFIEPHLKVYGGIRRILELSNRLAERGHDVTIFHSDGSSCQWMKCSAKVKRYEDVLEEEHDVLIYNDPNPVDYNLAQRSAARLKIFYVLELYERDLLKGMNLRIYLPRHERVLILKKSLNSPYLKLSNSTWIYTWLKENLHLESKLLIGGVNTDMFHPVEVKKNREEIRVLSSGDPRERKGFKTVVDAVERARKEDPRIILDTYHGKGIPQEKMAEKLSSADIFVDGQWYAGWNNPVAEAMACKVPVVCTDIGGVRDFAFHEKTALLVPVRDPKAMAEAILRLIRDEELRERLRENAYRHIIQFNWDESCSTLEKILESEVQGGEFNPSYTGVREDIIEMITSFPHIERVLDVGCSTGTLGEQIKNRLKSEVTGIEKDEKMAAVAAKKLDRVIVKDIEEVSLSEFDHSFDCIIFGDVLEHLKDPWETLKKMGALLRDDGVVIASIPNVGHYTTVFNLLFRKYWPYRSRGIHDRSHLRFFTLKNICELFDYAHLEIISVKRNYRIIERPHPLNRYSHFFGVPPFRDLLTFQYLVAAKRCGNV